MLKGKTESGFCFEIDETALDDMEFVEALADLEEDALKFPKVCNMLLGKDQKKKLYDHLRNENGKVPVEAVSNAIAEIMSVAGESTKNS